MDSSSAQDRERVRRTLALIDSIDDQRDHGLKNFFAKVQDLVIIASSSRGGSSIFTEILRSTPELVHFKAEINPFLLLSDLTYPNSGMGSDALTAQAYESPVYQAKIKRLEKHMALDAGICGCMDLTDPVSYRLFTDSLCWRLCVQWPTIELDLEHLLSLINDTFTDLERSHGWKSRIFKDLQLFHVLLLSKINAVYPEVNPYYYDLNPNLIRQFCPRLESRLGPPGSVLIEEPPFVPIYPWSCVTETMLKKYPLVIKTPSNAYRLPFLRLLFPNARFRILHLVRNPAASINGLYDGWQYNGFFSHRLETGFDFTGYSDLFPQWGRTWWKFDLPPGWQSRTEGRLEEICGFQWNSTHSSILNYVKENSPDYLRIRFEDVVGEPAARVECFQRIAQWLGIDAHPMIRTVSRELPTVMATSRPRQRRWFHKVELLTPVLDRPEILETTERLGYELTRDVWQ